MIRAPRPLRVLADAEAPAAFEDEEADQVPVGGAIHVRGDPGFAGLVDLQHQIVEDQAGLEGTERHGGEPAIPRGLIVSGQVAKTAVSSETVMHSHPLADEALASTDNGAGVAIPGSARLLEQPDAVLRSQRRHRDGALALQSIENLGNIDRRLDEPGSRRTAARIAGG